MTPKAMTSCKVTQQLMTSVRGTLLVPQRRNRAATRGQDGAMTAGAANTDAHLAPLARFARHLERLWRRQQPHESRRQLGLVVAELGIGSRVGARRNWRPRDGFLSRRSEEHTLNSS